jgi:hypothetical protein
MKGYSTPVDTERQQHHQPVYRHKRKIYNTSLATVEVVQLE